MKNKGKKIIFYLINLLIVVIVSGLTISKILKEHGVDALSYLKDISVFSIIVLTAIFFVNYYLEGIIISVSMKKYKKDFKPANGFVVQCVGGLFSAITPLKIGYFPSLGYAYSKYNVKADELIKSMAKTSFSYQILTLLLSVVSLIVCFSKRMVVTLGSTSLDLKYVALIGFAYNIVLFGGYFLLVLSPKIHNFVLKIIAWILLKIKKINDKDEYLNTKVEKMRLVREELKDYFKNIKESLIIFILYLFKNLMFWGLPYFVYLLIAKEKFNFDLYLYTIVLVNLISYITNIIPLPGASGAAEVVFIATFSLIYSSESLLTSVMLVWRVFSYFINIIVGFIVFAIIINVKKGKKAQEENVTVQ